MQKLYARLTEQEGQTMAEYATVLTVLTIACLTAFGLLAVAASGALTRFAKLLG
jgi:Flp pilus assembly pilin Flp